MDKYREAARTIAPLGERARRDATVGYAWEASLARLGELTQPTQVLSEYEKIQLSPEAIVLVGQLWTDMGDYSRAVRAFQRVLDRNPSLAKVHYFAGLAQLRWNHENEALSEFNNALRLAPDDADPKIGIVYVYMLRGRQAEAIDLFRSLVAAHPDANYKSTRN